jgi:hypothetical protein
MGVSTLRRGHAVLFIFGILFPIMWIAGALLPPTPGAMRAA